MNSRTEARRVTSSGSAIVSPPSSLAVRWASARSTSPIATFMPSAVSACAVARPMPRAAPVIAATPPMSVRGCLAMVRPPLQSGGRRERARQSLDPVDERAALVHLRLAGFDVREPLVDLGEDGAQLGAGQRRTEAVVRPAAAEADVAVRIPRDVEAPRVVEGLVVAVGRVVEEDDLLAGGDRPAVQLDVARRGPAERKHRRRPAHELL